MATTPSGTSEATVPGSATSGGGYFPNVDGSSWTYNLTNNSTTDVFTYRTTYSGAIAANGTTYQIQIVEDFSRHDATSEAFWIVNNDTAKNYGSGGTTPSSQANYTLLSFPLQLNKTWIVAVQGAQEVIGTMEAHESLTVPAGTYADTFRLHAMIGNSQEIYFWISKDVGLTKQIQIQYLPTYSISTYELTAKNF